MSFLDIAYKRNKISGLINTSKDLLPIIKKNNKFLDNYKLSTVLSEYKIENQSPHHADFDAKSTYQVALKLINEGKLKL